MRSGFYLAVTIPFLLAMAVNAYGLTTFGKSNSPPNPGQQQPPQNTLPKAKGRTCTLEKDCESIQNTSCVPDPSERKVSRCLCGDYEAPINGACKSNKKGPNHICMANEDCIEGAECMKYKEAGVRGVDKVCKCTVGFYEADSICNGGQRINGISTFISVTIVILSGIMAY